MTASPTISALERKTRASAPRGARGGSVEAWRRTLPRVAEDRLGLELSVLAAEEGETTLADSVSGLPEGSLLVALGFSGRVGGLAIVDMQLLAALIEIQTTRQVSSSRRDPRPGTATDFELVAHVIDGWCAAIAEAAGDGRRGLTCARLFHDARAVHLALDEGTFRETRLELDLGGGRRTGILRLIVPPPEDGAGKGLEPGALCRTLLPLAASLDAVLCRVRLPLSRALALSVGEVIDLGEVELRRITLEAPVGHVICRAHIGQSRGFRAVRVLATAAEDVGGAAPPSEGFDRLLVTDADPPAHADQEELAPPEAVDLPDLPDLPETKPPPDG